MTAAKRATTTVELASVIAAIAIGRDRPLTAEVATAVASAAKVQQPPRLADVGAGAPVPPLCLVGQRLLSWKKRWREEDDGPHQSCDGQQGRMVGTAAGQTSPLPGRRAHGVPGCARSRLGVPIARIAAGDRLLAERGGDWVGEQSNFFTGGRSEAADVRGRRRSPEVAEENASGSSGVSSLAAVAAGSHAGLRRQFWRSQSHRQWLLRPRNSRRGQATASILSSQGGHKSPGGLVEGCGGDCPRGLR